jgi:hypothetical protein
MNNGLNADENKICALMGVNPHAYIEDREKERASKRGLNQEAPNKLESKIATTMGLSPAEAKEVKDKTEKEAAARAPLTPEELEICRQLGVEPTAYWAQKMTDAGLKPQLPA